MNKIYHFFFALALWGLFAQPLSAKSVDLKKQKATQLYRQGTAALKNDDYELAKECFIAVLKIYPGQPQAKRQLLYLQSNRQKLEINKRKKSLAKVTIAKVDLDQVSLQESIEILSALIKQSSKEKKAPNIIIQDPDNQLKGKTITLNLINIPASTLLRYIAEQSGSIARFDAHAIVITPKPH